MNRTTIKAAIAASLLCLSAVAPHAIAHAQEGPAVTVLGPMSGPGTSGAGKFLLNTVVGSKQAVGYFLSENGHCKVTIMVADAFDGEEVPDSAAVRFEVALNVGASARMDTAEGKSLEFGCEERAEQLTIRAQSLPPVYPSGS